jgi:hypothetical protein
MMKGGILIEKSPSFDIRNSLFDILRFIAVNFRDSPR